MAGHTRPVRHLVGTGETWMAGTGPGYDEKENVGSPRHARTDWKPAMTNAP
jgi:hypothetical protein